MSRGLMIVDTRVSCTPATKRCVSRFCNKSRQFFYSVRAENTAHLILEFAINISVFVLNSVSQLLITRRMVKLQLGHLYTYLCCELLGGRGRIVSLSPLARGNFGECCPSHS